MSKLNKLTFDGTDYAIGTEYVAYCTTASSTNVKVVTTLNATGFELANGTLLHVIFANAHTSGAAISLNVNGLGQKNIYNKAGKYVYYLPKGYYTFVYYGGYWYLNGKAYEDLSITGSGGVITNIDAKDWTNGIAVTKGEYEAYHSSPLSQASSISMDALTGSGSLSSFWTGTKGDTLHIALASGTLDFGQIPIATTSKNRRFHIYVMAGEFKLYGCTTNIDTQAYINCDRAPVLLKCWLAQKSILYQWLVEITYFSYSY